MIARWLPVVLVAVIAAGCGAGSSPPRQSAGVHLNGKRAQGDFVLETDASGAQFLVPAAVLSGQGSRAFDVSAPAAANMVQANPVSTPSPTTQYRIGVAIATAVVPHSAHVELLATGDPGRRFLLSWEETCGWTQQGISASGGTGGGGSQLVTSPAVALVRLPRITHGVPSCYVAATASTTTFTRQLHLAVIDY